MMHRISLLSPDQLLERGPDATMIDSFVRLALGGLFLSAGLGKLVGRRHFVAALGSYRLVPRRTARTLSWAVILGEIGGAVLTVLPDPWGRAGPAMFAVIALGGAVLTTVDLGTGHGDHPCGCLGDAPSARLRWWHPVRAALVGLIALALALSLAPRSLSLAQPISLVLLPISALVWTAVLATAGLVFGEMAPRTHARGSNS